MWFFRVVDTAVVLALTLRCCLFGRAFYICGLAKPATQDSTRLDCVPALISCSFSLVWWIWGSGRPKESLVAREGTVVCGVRVGDGLCAWHSCSLSTGRLFSQISQVLLWMKRLFATLHRDTRSHRLAKLDFSRYNSPFWLVLNVLFLPRILDILLILIY